jgi:hypothetical protein
MPQYHHIFCIQYFNFKLAAYANMILDDCQHIRSLHQHLMRQNDFRKNYKVPLG